MYLRTCIHVNTYLSLYIYIKTYVCCTRPCSIRVYYKVKPSYKTYQSLYVYVTCTHAQKISIYEYTYFYFMAKP